MTQRRRRWLLRAALVAPLLLLAHWAAYRAGAASVDGEPPQSRVVPVPQPPRVPGSPDPEMPAYPNAPPPDPLADSISVQGIPMQLRELITGDDVPAVIDHYAKLFASRGYVVKSGRYPGGVGYVTYRPPKRHDEVMNVTAMPYGGQTLVILSRADPRKMLLRPAAQPTDLALPAGAEGTVAVDTAEGGERNRVVMFTLPGRSASAASCALRDALLAGGWSSRRSEEAGRNPLVATYVRGPSTAVATLRYDPAREAAVGLITTTEPAPPPAAVPTACPAPPTRTEPTP